MGFPSLSPPLFLSWIHFHHCGKGPHCPSVLFLLAERVRVRVHLFFSFSPRSKDCNFLLVFLLHKTPQRWPEIGHGHVRFVGVSASQRLQRDRSSHRQFVALQRK